LTLRENPDRDNPYKETAVCRLLAGAVTGLTRQGVRGILRASGHPRCVQMHFGFVGSVNRDPPMPKVTITVTLKPTLLDAQGRTVESALHTLGFDEVSGLRIGKVIEMQLPDGIAAEEIEARAATMCDKLLANPVTESYRIEVH